MKKTKKENTNKPKKENTDKLIKLKAGSYTIEELENIISDSKVEDGTVLVKLDDGNTGIYEYFVIQEEDWDYLCPRIIDEKMYFGEIAGKHSEVITYIELVDTIRDKKEISKFLKLHPEGYTCNHSFLECLSFGFLDLTLEDEFGKDSTDEKGKEEFIKCREIYKRIIAKTSRWGNNI